MRRAFYAVGREAFYTVASDSNVFFVERIGGGIFLKIVKSGPKVINVFCEKDRTVRIVEAETESATALKSKNRLWYIA